MEFNAYQVSGATLVAIAAVVVGGVVLGVMLDRCTTLSRSRCLWIAVAATSAVVILLITLSPSGRGGTYRCEFEVDRSVLDIPRINQSTANVAMLVPLAVALPRATRSTRWWRWSFVGLVILPVVIEVLQAAVPLGRACDWMDVVDNWIGVALGCVLGWAGTAGASILRRRRDRSDQP